MTTGITAKKLIRTLGILFLFVLIVGYGVWRSKDVLFGVDLSVTGLTNGMHATASELTFSGVAPHVTAVTVDGRTVPTAQDGTWTDTISLLSGYNVITIASTDKFKRTTSKHYQVFYDEPMKATLPSPAPVVPAADTTVTPPVSTAKPTGSAGTSPSPATPVAQ